LYFWFILDESPRVKHDGPGLLSMAIADRDKLGSHFIITLKADHHLDRFAILIFLVAFYFLLGFYILFVRTM